MKLAGIDAATNQSVEITTVDTGILLTTATGSIEIPKADITEFDVISHSTTGSHVIRLDGAVSMSIVPEDPSSAISMVDDIRNWIQANADCDNKGSFAGGLFDSSEPATRVPLVEDTSAYVRPPLPATASPALRFSERISHSAAARTAPSLHRLLVCLLTAFVAVGLAGLTTTIVRTLTVNTPGITVMERIDRFTSSIFITASALSITASTTLMVRLVAAMNSDDSVESLPVVGRLDSALTLTTHWTSRAIVSSATLTGLGVLTAVAAAPSSSAWAVAWLMFSAVIAAWSLSISAAIAQLGSQLGGTVALWEETRHEF